MGEMLQKALKRSTDGGAYRVLPCPFCGKDPETMGSGEGQRGLMIHCIADGCVNPHVSYYDHASAIRAWNRRDRAVGSETERGK